MNATLDRKIDRKTPIELYRVGVDALNRALGPAEAIRFLRLLDNGSGDYTAERQARMEKDEGTLEELSAAIRVQHGGQDDTQAP